MGTIFKTKEVGMKWFKRLIYRWYQDGRELIDNEPAVLSGSTRKLRRVNPFGSSDVEGEDGLNISVRKAIGGKIVTFRQYDERNDRNHYKLYVIPDDLDFDKELGKMITLESMRM
jgi:hypothetical protein